MSEKKDTLWEAFKKYGLPTAGFVSGVVFERYVLPRIEEKIKNRDDGKIFATASDFLADFKGYLQDKPQYDSLKELVTALESYLSVKKYREQNK